MFSPSRLLCIIMSMLLLLAILPIDIWIIVLHNMENFRGRCIFREVYESSTLYYVITRLTRPSSYSLKLLKPNVVHSGNNFDLALYHRLINEVVRLHRSSSGSYPSFIGLSDQRNRASTGQQLEALQALKAAEFHQNSGQLSKARKLLEHAFRLDPDNVDILVALGEAIEGSWVVNRQQQDNGSPSSSKSLAPFPSFSFSDIDELLYAADHMYTRALTVNPGFDRAGRSKDRLMPLVEEVDQRRFNVIDLKVRQFYQIPETNAGLRQAKFEHYFKHIYHTNAIEGNTLTLAQTRSILETRLAVGGKSLMEQNEVLGLDAALRYINATLLLGRLTPISLDTVMQLHRHILSFVDPSEAGRFRRTQVFIAAHRPPPPDAVPHLMHELISWLNSQEVEDVHPIELAALMHWKLVYIHPFYDGNGRTARLLMNLILMRAGLPPAIIKVEDRPAYYERLKMANEGDVRPFIRFIAMCTERTIDEYLEASVEMAGLIIEDTPLVSSGMPFTTPALSTKEAVHRPQSSAKIVQSYSNRQHSDLRLPNVIYLG
ncbi:unnamed protein product [Dicrocoelium dendriticum]|nr:unnamed protein product [Dicrocoelium dendriticum]